MSEMKQYVILGLGIFGSTIAKTLSQYNHEVIAIDKDLACVDRVSDFVTQAIQADFTDIDQHSGLRRGSGGDGIASGRKHHGRHEPARAGNSVYHGEGEK